MKAHPPPSPSLVGAAWGFAAGLALGVAAVAALGRRGPSEGGPYDHVNGVAIGYGELPWTGPYAEDGGIVRHAVLIQFAGPGDARQAAHGRPIAIAPGAVLVEMVGGRVPSP